MFRKPSRRSLSLDKLVKHHFYNLYTESRVYIPVGCWEFGIGVGVTDQETIGANHLCLCRGSMVWG